jgi:hypothetical protein
MDNLESNQYFLARISEFEKQYGMESWRFQFLYENHRKNLPGYNGRSAVDYSEWAFLCENFSHIDSTLYESPPEMVNETDQQKPERRSGFCVSGSKCDWFGASIFRPRRESSFELPSNLRQK